MHIFSNTVLLYSSILNRQLADVPLGPSTTAPVVAGHYKIVGYTIFNTIQL